MSDSRLSIVLGERSPHLSNGNTAAENPSVDLRSIVLGIQSRRYRRSTGAKIALQGLPLASRG